VTAPLSDYPTTDADTPLGLALAFSIRTGRRVFFIASTAKVPLAGSHGHLDASADLETITAMYPGPGCRWAWRPNPDELVIDTDPQNGYTDGAVDLPETETYGPTPHGGQHRVYARNGYDVHSDADAGGPGVDFKTERGWLVGYHKDSNGAARVDAPAWVATAQTTRAGRHRMPETIPEGEIDVTLTSIAGSLHNFGFSEDEIAETLSVIADHRAPTHSHGRDDFERIARSAANWRRAGRIGEITPGAVAARGWR
jgi:hypothetical protein